MTDIIVDALDKLEIDSYYLKRQGARHYRSYDENVVIEVKEGVLIKTHKNTPHPQYKINHTPLDIGIIEMANDTEELKDLIAFSNYSQGFQLVDNDYYYRSAKMDVVLGGSKNYTFLVMHDDEGYSRLYIKIHLDRI